MKCIKPWISICLIFILLISGCGNQQEKTGNAALDGELEIGENQTLYVGQVTQINGNEITLALAEEIDMSNMRGERSGNSSQVSGQNTASQSAIASQEVQENQSIEENNNQSQNTSEAVQGNVDNSGGMSGVPSGDSNGQMSGGPGGDSNGQMSGGPGGDGNGQMPERPDGEQNGVSSDNTNGSNTNQKTDSNDSNTKENSNKKQSMTAYQLTGDEKTMLIPVGTPVTTLLGTNATFSRISSESMVKIVTEKDANGNEVIVSVWIVG